MDKSIYRKRSIRAETDRYAWVEMAAPCLSFELVAAFLCAKKEKAESVAWIRMVLWDTYHSVFADAEKQRKLRRSVIT